MQTEECCAICLRSNHQTTFSRFIDILHLNFPSIWEWVSLGYISGLDVFLPFPHSAIPRETSVITVTFNTMRLLVTILILMTCCFAFDAGKVLLASNYVVSVLLAFQTRQWIHNVRINLQTKEVGRTGSPNMSMIELVFIWRPSHWTVIFLTPIMPGAEKLPIFPLCLNRKGTTYYKSLDISSAIQIVCTTVLQERFKNKVW